MKLENLTPRPSKIYLSSMGKEYTLRPWSLKDQIFMNQEYGDRVNEIFNKDKIDLVAICRMVYRLIADKNDFKAIEVNEIDENGNEIKYKLGGYKLLIHKVTDYKDQVKLMTGLLECIGLSSPELKELKNLGEESEKKS
jgi:hypothetical protein